MVTHNDIRMDYGKALYHPSRIEEIHEEAKNSRFPPVNIQTTHHPNIIVFRYRCSNPLRVIYL
jgi:hypothetical protein